MKIVEAKIKVACHHETAEKVESILGSMDFPVCVKKDIADLVESGFPEVDANHMTVEVKNIRTVFDDSSEGVYT